MLALRGDRDHVTPELLRERLGHDADPSSEAAASQARSQPNSGQTQPKIVAKRQKRLSGIDELVISLAAKGLTTGEVQAHLAEVYGAQVSRQTISTITDKVLEGMAEWQNRPLDPGRSPVIVANRPKGRFACLDTHRTRCQLR
jgi:hypothetical protein